ncbi:hypothetical protein BGZ99_008496 [Dissophora globulifera]|uniref:Uncharacterized protein n=1 Tax=Dissophora globulifera TaxID=979702 RepID=A0A9P6R9J3_9FUNG|nr:hypothetical protein BGZ99_008496 [Dissophora globulifera]
MDTIHFPDTRLVRVGSQVTQIATFIGDGKHENAAKLELSIDAQKLLQSIIWATIASPPPESTVHLNHDEFSLTITQRPWRLTSKYDILIDGETMEPTPYKLWFTLHPSPESQQQR